MSEEIKEVLETEEVEPVVATDEKKKKRTPKKDAVSTPEKVVEKTEVKTKRKTRTEIPKNELICTRSAVEGRLTYISPKTGMTVIWENTGAEEYIEFSELVTMKASRSRFLTEPWLIIEDEEVIEYLGLKHLYNSIVDPDEVDDFLITANHRTLSKKIENMPTGTKRLLSDRARKLIKDERLNDLRVIRVLEEKLNVEFFTTID